MGPLKRTLFDPTIASTKGAQSWLRKIVPSKHFLRNNYSVPILTFKEAGVPC